MPTVLTTDIEIMAPPGAVWQALTDFSSYAAWNPFIRSAEGEARVGSRVRFSFSTPRGIAMKATAVLVQVEPDYALRWIGSLLVPYLMDIEHSFLLEEPVPGRTRLVQSEHFGGVLVPVFLRVLKNEIMDAYRSMNEALKQRAESLGAV